MEDDALFARLDALPPGAKIKLKIVPPPRANEPYTDAEIETILTTVPTRQNVVRLAKLMGRSRDAISTLYKLAYSGNWLKKMLEDKPNPEGGNNVHQRIASVKERLEIVVGYQPKAKSLTIGGPVGY